MAQDWETPTSYSAAATPQTAAAYAMRPLSLGEVLDRTFSVYKSRFWLFAGIGAVSAALQTLISAVQLIPMHLAGAAGTLGKARPVAGIPASPLSPNYLAGIGIGVALGFVVVTMLGESVRATIGRWYRYLGIGIWQAGSMLWIPAVVVLAGALLMATKITGLAVLGGFLALVGILAGLPVGFILWLRNSLAVQATVIEGLPVRASMARSKVLTAGSKGRIFVLMLLAGALSYVASLLQMPLLFFVAFTMASGGKAIGSEIAMLVVGFVGHAAVQPILMIGLSLIYFDQRVRKEAFDLLMLLGPETVPVVPAAPVVWPPVAPVEAAVWPPVAETAGMTAAPISVEPMSTEPILATPLDESLPRRSDDETSL
jgi:hypothetical protein